MLVMDIRMVSISNHVLYPQYPFCRFRQAADPSLLRSVLVCNTLRALERDLGPPRCPDPPPAPLGHYASQCHHLHHLHHGYATEDCYDRCPGVGGVMGGDSGGRLTPFVRPEAMTPLWTDEDRLPSLNWSSVLNFGTAPVAPPQPSSPEGSSTTSSSTGEHGGPAPLYTLLPAHNGTGVVSSASGATCTTSSSSAGSSSSSSDEIFGDIDLSLYDFDLLSPLSPPNVKVAPVSADDLMRSLAASSQTDCVVTTSASAATCQLVASSGQQVNFCYKPIGEDHVATVMSWASPLDLIRCAVHRAARKKHNGSSKQRTRPAKDSRRLGVQTVAH